VPEKDEQLEVKETKPIDKLRKTAPTAMMSGLRWADHTGKYPEDDRRTSESVAVLVPSDKNQDYFQIKRIKNAADPQSLNPQSGN